MTHLPTSLVDILRWRATNQAQRMAYRFLPDGEDEEVVVTHEELDRRARSIGAILQSSAKAGDRALLLFPPGPDFIGAYFGCLYANVIAVPAYPPHPARLEKILPMILGIMADATPAVVLLNASLLDSIQSRDGVMAAFGNTKLLVTGKNEMDDCSDNWQEPVISGHDIAFLQYTSGSTTMPKGVMVSHSNLLHNLGLIEKCFGQSSQSHAVIWLPPYHDMGLVGGILQPLYSGYPATLMPHLMFLQNPFRWLQAISRYRATTSGGPNFAFELCLKKIKPEQRELLDLSCWDAAFNGAEPVYHKTLDAFAEYFAPCGFRREAFLPCYGLAEATLMVSGGPKARTPVIISPTNEEDSRALTGCGQIMPDQKIRIVDPETMIPCNESCVGEIWVSGPGVAGGYWNKPSATEITFKARLSGNGEGPFLRTGDLGFIQDGELFITGRLKDLIIYDGSNYYPHDIERTVEGSHPAIRPAGCAAFSVNDSGNENIIIMAEIGQQTEVKEEEIIKAIRRAVSLHHELPVADILLTIPGGIPKTPSGKIKHYLCKTIYMNRNLKETAIP